MKEITEQERRAIEEVANELCNTAPYISSQRDFIDGMLKGAEFLAKLRAEEKPSKDLVEQIDNIFEEASLYGYENTDRLVIGESKFHSIATEIANLAPMQVNAGLFEALKGIERCCDNQNQSHEHIWRIAYGAIQNYESKILESSKTCEQ